MIAMPSPPEPMEPLADIPAAEAFPPARTRPLTPGEALAKLFMDNADHGRNDANDELVSALRERARAIQSLAGPRPPETTPHPQLPDITAQE